MSRSFPFLSISASFPYLFLGMSASFPMHVPFIANNFPTSPFVCFGILVLCFRFIPPSLPLHFSFLSPSLPFQFPFVSLSVPLAFISTSCPLHVLSFPFISRPSFCLRFPCISPSLPGIFPRNKKVVFNVSQNGGRKYDVFPGFRQKEAEHPNQQRAGTGIRAWDPCFATPARRRLFFGTWGTPRI